MSIPYIEVSPNEVYHCEELKARDDRNAKAFDRAFEDLEI